MSTEQHHRTDWLDALLEFGDVYEVGGSVRDQLLAMSGRRGKDRDYLVCGISLDDLQKRLRRFGTVNLVGKSFGVIKFQPRTEPGVIYDIALPRREQSTGSGHTDFTVDFDPHLPVEVDLGRRDFTINAIARHCATGNLVDPSGGAEDCQKRRLRMVFPRALEEDPLRILRGVQLAARMGLAIESDTYDAMHQSAAKITTISIERIAEELNKLMAQAPRPSVGLALLQELDILKLILPELEDTVDVDQPGGFHTYDVFIHTLHTIDACAPRLRLRWAALLHDINKPQCRVVGDDKATFYGHESRGARTAKRVLKRLRYPHHFAEQVSVLVERHMFTSEVGDKGLRRLIRRIGGDLIYDLLDLRRADVVAQGKGGCTDDIDELEQRIISEIAGRAPFGRSDLAIDGHDLTRDLGIPPGPEMGEILSQLLELVLDNPKDNTRAALLEAARKIHHDKKF